jgi:hypothetical protein
MEGSLLGQVSFTAGNFLMEINQKGEIVKMAAADRGGNGVMELGLYIQKRS